MIVEGQWAVSEFNANVDYGVAELPGGHLRSLRHRHRHRRGDACSTTARRANNAAVTFVQWLSSPAQGAYLTATSGGLPSGPGQLT